MTEPLNIGVDFGSTALRAAWRANGGPPVALDQEPPLPVLTEPARDSSLGVSFPALKSKLGVETSITLDGDKFEPAQIAEDRLRELRRAVEKQTSRRVARAVVSVPARYSATQRAALREATRGAGFADARLINDPIAAVTAYMEDRAASATVLVYSMGFAGWEIGLIRTAAGRYRALGYEGGSSPAGGWLDEIVARTLLDTAAERNLVPDTPRWEASTWLQVRADAQRVKESLSATERASSRISLQTPDGGTTGGLELTRSSFERAIDASLDITLERCAGLIEFAKMKPESLDAVLLVGGSTAIPLLRDKIERVLGKSPVSMRPGDLARGAAIHAAELESTLPDAPSGDSTGDVWEVEVPAADVNMRASILVANADSAGSSSERLVLLARDRSRESGESAESLLRQARNVVERLANAGRIDEARCFLTRLADEAKAALERLQTAPSRSTNGDESDRSAANASTRSDGAPSREAAIARRLLGQARELIAQGHCDEAVGKAHLAWEYDCEDPNVLEDMIRVHCEAADADQSPAAYEAAQRWLQCALVHDQANRGVREQLAERHYSQAKHLRARGERRKALEVVERCLQWNPGHEGGYALRKELGR